MAELKKIFGGDYAIDRSGKLWSLKGGDKSPVATREDHDGYLRANISVNGEIKTVYLHKLVAQAFLTGSGHVLHGDGNRKNNSAANLRYGTVSENAKDREQHARTDSWEAKWQITAEGFLEANEIVVAREGLLVYPDRTEWVTAEALTTMAATLTGKPVVFEHPPTHKVTAGDTGSIKGTVLRAWTTTAEDGVLQCVASAVIYDAALVDLVVKGIREVSPGYDVQVAQIPDAVKEKYGNADVMQTSRISNHLAVTRAGRGGEKASIRFDAKEEEPMTDEEKKELEALKAKNDALEEENSKLKAKADALEALQKQKRDADKEEDDKRADSLFVAKFNERLAVIKAAESAGVTNCDSLTTEDIKAAVVRSVLGADFRADSTAAMDAAYQVVLKTRTPSAPERLASGVRQDSATPKTPANDDLFAFYKENN